MAVTAEGSQFIVLDEEYRIVEVGPTAAATFGPLLGRLVYDAFPDCKPLFQPYYERARRTGATVSFATFYDGYVLHLRASPIGSMLRISWDTLVHLDVLTLDGLKTSLNTALATISELTRDAESEQRRTTLHVVGGTG